MTKKDEDNPDFISIILCSKGLGANYAKENQLKHRWNKEKGRSFVWLLIKMVGDSWWGGSAVYG